QKIATRFGGGGAAGMWSGDAVGDVEVKRLHGRTIRSKGEGVGAVLPLEVRRSERVLVRLDEAVTEPLPVIRRGDVIGCAARYLLPAQGDANGELRSVAGAD